MRTEQVPVWPHELRALAGTLRTEAASTTPPRWVWRRLPRGALVAHYAHPDTPDPLFGLRGPVNSAAVLRRLCALIQESASAAAVEVPPFSAFEPDPGQAFVDFLTALRSALPGRIPFLMFDEFQLLLQAIARPVSGMDRDALVLDLLRWP